MKLKHFLGEFKDMAAVQAAFPGGGSEGDYLVVDGVLKGWDIENNIWADPIKKDVAPVRETEQMYGDLDVHHNLRVGGRLSAKLIRGRNAFLGLFADETSMRLHYPTPSIGEWAMVLAYTIPATANETNTEETSSETSSNEEEVVDDISVGYIYICEVPGVWKATDKKGGFGSNMFEAVEAERERAQTAEETLQGNINAEEARATEAEEDVIYDVSARNHGMVYIENPAYLIPESKRKNGMIIKFLTYRANCIVFDFGTNPDSEQRDKINNAIRLSEKMPFDKSGRYLIPAVLAAIVGTTDYETIRTAISENLQEVDDEVTFYTTVEENEGTRYFYYKIVRELGAYAFYRNEAATFNTSESSWISVDFKVRENSKHLATSGMVYDAVKAEEERAHNAEETLQGNIDAEAQARQQADATLQGNIDAEAQARQQADATLQGNIDAEAQARQQADATLQGNIDAEAQARQQADATLQGNIDTEETRAKGVEGELGDAIETVNSKIPSAATAGNKLTDKKYVDDKVSDERSRAMAVEETLQSTQISLNTVVTGEIARATVEEAKLKDRVEDIEAVISEQASRTNKLADKDFVNSSIATATATHRGTFNLVSDLGLPVTATHTQIANRIASKLTEQGIVADNNDYVFVQISNEASKPEEILRVERYKNNGTRWAFEYELNNSSFTAAQWAALNSGITETQRETMQAEIAANKAKIAALAAGIDVNISFSPSVIYKNVETSVTITGTMVNGVPTNMKLMDGETVIHEGAASPLSDQVSVNISTNTKTFKVVGESSGVTLSKEGNVTARYPIYYGFDASPEVLAVSSLNRYAPTTSAAHTYNSQNGTNGQHFYILVPSDISALSSFTMNGAPFVMTASTEVINGITYKVYTSGNTYNAGTQVTVVAS